MCTTKTAAVAALARVGACRWAVQVEQLVERIGHHAGRAETRQRLGTVITALLGDVGRKNCWTLAEHAGEAGPWGMQHLLARAVWETDAAAGELRGFVVEHLGAADGVLIVDETGDAKKGRSTVGVKRQYSGTTGRVENCQVAVHLAYATKRGHALVDYSTPTGRMLAGIFASLAEYERELMHERAAATRTAARLWSRHTGRPPQLDTAPTQTRQVRSLRDGGESITDLVSSFGVSRATIYRALQATDTAADVPAPSVGFSQIRPGSDGRENDLDVGQ